MNTIATAMRRAFRPAPTPTVVPLRRPPDAEHAPTPAPAPGVGNPRTPTDLDGTFTAIYDALLHDGWTATEAAEIVRCHGEHLAELAARTALAHANRLERAMPGSGVAR